MKTLIKRLTNEHEMLALSAQLARAVNEGMVVFLEGPLGAGKTTFTRGFLRGLGYVEKVKSPTYTLVEPYAIADRHVFHFDFYRLQDPHELEYIGIHDYFFPAAICLIEWPDKGLPFLPPPDLICAISFMDTGREIRIEAHSARGESALEKV